MKSWEIAGIVVEGDPITISGINPWAFEWRQVQDDPVELPHPSYPNQRHWMWVYEIDSGGRQIRFATGEVSANIWAFYIPAH